MEAVSTYLFVFLRLFGFFLNSFIIVVINTFRPILGYACCRFEETCTPYAIRQLKEHQVFRALWNIATRILLCSPLPFNYNNCVAKRLSSLRSLISK